MREGGTFQTRRTLDALDRAIDGLKELRDGRTASAQRGGHGGYRELIRRDDQPVGPDGYPTSVGGSSDSTVMTRSIRSRTETAALRLAEHGPERDEVHEARREVEAYTFEALGIVNRMVAKTIGALTLGESKRGRQSTVSTCANCARDVAGTEKDRLRAGRCEPCYRHRLATGDDRRMRPTGDAA